MPKKRQTSSVKKIVAILAAAVAACLAAGFLLTAVLIPGHRLNRAVRLLEDGNRDVACALLEELGKSGAIPSRRYACALSLFDRGEYRAAYVLMRDLDCGDSGDLLPAYRLAWEKDQLSGAQAGDTVLFGACEQDNDLTNGKEDVEWLVLEKWKDRALLISLCGLNAKPFDPRPAEYGNTGPYWSTCFLREWLNGAFLNAAFNGNEQPLIKGTAVPAALDGHWEESGIYTWGEPVPEGATADRLFLLSAGEASRYFPRDEDRICRGTAYCFANGAAGNADGSCWWWLRDSAAFNHAARVTEEGWISGYGNGYGAVINSTKGAVRPVMWVVCGP